MKVVTADQMRQIDQECDKIGLPTSALMENAGKAVAEEVRRILGTIDQQYIVMLIGPGNNGGDGLVAARYLRDWGARVSLYLFGQRPADDSNLELVRERGIACVDVAEEENLDGLDDRLSSATAVVDERICTGCQFCLAVCPYSGAISFDEGKKVCQVNEALCKGCGACIGGCPSDAISLSHFTNEQILAEMEGALV